MCVINFQLWPICIKRMMLVGFGNYSPKMDFKAHEMNGKMNGRSYSVER